MGGVNFQSPSCCQRSISVSDRRRTVPVGIAGIDGAIHANRGKTRFTTEGLEDVGAVVGEAIAGPGRCSFPTRRISWVADDELSLR